MPFFPLSTLPFLLITILHEIGKPSGESFRKEIYKRPQIMLCNHVCCLFPVNPLLVRGDNESCRIESIKIMINESYRVNSFTEWVRKSSTTTRSIYKHVNMFTIRVTRLISVSCQIILELIRLNLNNPLKERD